MGRSQWTLPGRSHSRSALCGVARVDFSPAFGDQEKLFAEQESFVADVVAGKHATVEPDRVLATVLFSDIVGSSEKAAALGDRAWASCSSGVTSSSRPACSVFAARRWTRRVTASSPPSTAPPERTAVPAPSPVCARPRLAGASWPARRRMRARGRQGGGHRGAHGRSHRRQSPTRRGTGLEHSQRSGRRLWPRLRRPRRPPA
jgi:class 3 adenylate cyclase